MSVVSLINNKGGVGKTTTAIHLAHALGRDNDVLLVDLDGQASASLALGCDRSNLEPSLASILYDGREPEDVILSAPGGNLDLLTGSERLQNADIRLSGELGREKILDEILDDLRPHYDVIILDCPPSMSLLPINAVVASDWFIVPVEPHYLALEGVGSLLDTVTSIRKEIGCDAELLGVVAVKADYRANATEQAIDMLREDHGEKMFDTVVRVNVRVAEAASFGTTVFEHAPNSTGAGAYSALADEVRQRLNL